MTRDPSFLELFADLKIPDKILVAALTGLTIGEEVVDSLPNPRHVVRLVYTTQPIFKGIKKYSFRQALLRLLQSKYLEKIEADAQGRYQITQEGLEHLYRKHPQLRLKSAKFDGFFRIVVYDIDEVERKLRREMRRGLKKLGFAFLQQSVWASPFDWEKELDSLFGRLKVGERVFIFKSQLSPERTARLLSTYWPHLKIA